METLLKKLRNRKTNTASFRKASRKVSARIFSRLAVLLKKRQVPREHIAIVIILRSAIALLEPALTVFPKAPVGVLGFKREENTFKPKYYYENLPPLFKKSTVILLDPMLATGGSAEAAILRLKKHGVRMQNIYFLGIIGAPEGIARITHFIPKENIILATVDKGLDAQKYIIPGLGDFGDRYFGHTGSASLR